MYYDVAREALERLNRINYKSTPDFGLSSEVENLISVISNECKATVLQSREDNKYIAKYGSNIRKDAVLSIVRELIRNGNYIPKETMQNISYINGQFLGFDRDIEIYKGIDSETSKRVINFDSSYIDVRDVSGGSQMYEELSNLYELYAREMIFEDYNRKKDEKIFTQAKCV